MKVKDSGLLTPGKSIEKMDSDLIPEKRNLWILKEEKFLLVVGDP